MFDLGGPWSELLGKTNALRFAFWDCLSRACDCQRGRLPLLRWLWRLDDGWGLPILLPVTIPVSRGNWKAQARQEVLAVFGRMCERGEGETEGEGERDSRERQPFVVLLVDAFIGWYLSVPWPGIGLITLMYWDKTLTNCVMQSGPRLQPFWKMFSSSEGHNFQTVGQPTIGIWLCYYGIVILHCTGMVIWAMWQLYLLENSCVCTKSWLAHTARTFQFIEPTALPNMCAPVWRIPRCIQGYISSSLLLLCRLNLKLYSTAWRPEATRIAGPNSVLMGYWNELGAFPSWWTMSHWTGAFLHHHLKNQKNSFAFRIHLPEKVPWGMLWGGSKIQC